MIQANGQIAPAGNSNILVPTVDEVRLETYTAITIDVQGVGYWAYNHCCGVVGSSNTGMSTNPALFEGVKKIQAEIRAINDYLVLPTVGNSWHERYDDTHVTFSHPDLTRRVTNLGVRRKLNYILKQDTTTGKSLLIVVNKDASALTDVQISVPGLANRGEQKATTLGLQSTGSQRAGRTLTVTNGAFTDTFDGHAAHVYEIESVAEDTDGDDGSEVSADEGTVQESDGGQKRETDAAADSEFEEGSADGHGNSLDGGCYCGSARTGAQPSPGFALLGLAFLLRTRRWQW